MLHEMCYLSTLHQCCARFVIWIPYLELKLLREARRKILSKSISKLPKMHSEASGGARVLAARITLLLARSCLLRADLKFFGSPEGTSNALFRSTWPFFRSNWPFFRSSWPFVARTGRFFARSDRLESSRCVPTSPPSFEKYEKIGSNY